MGGLVGVLHIETWPSPRCRNSGGSVPPLIGTLQGNSGVTPILWILWIRHNNLQHWCWVESRAEYLFQSFNELEILKLFEWRLQHNKPWVIGDIWQMRIKMNIELDSNISLLWLIFTFGAVWRCCDVMSDTRDTDGGAGPGGQRARVTQMSRCHVKRGWWPEHWSHCACYSGCGLLPVCGGRYTVDTRIHRLCCLPGNQTFSFYYFRFSKQLSDFITKQGKRNVKASVKLEPHEIRWL